MSLLNKCRHIRFWPLLALLTVAIIGANAAAVTASGTTALWRADANLNVAAGAAKDEKHTRDCKALCGHCGCLGFYCGEECICECNGNKENGDADTECIATMQSNARKLDIPFELLIQGPSTNRFVRNARQFEQNVVVAAADANASRNKRSTVVIYKPAVQNSVSGQCGMKPSKKSVDAIATTRHKRSVGEQLNWFTDFANTLVRPAPLGVPRSQRKVATDPEDDAAATSAQQKRSTDDVNSSWFADNKNLLLRPAPLFKRHRSSKNEAGDDDSSANLPQVDQLLKETLKNLQDNALSDDFAQQLRDRLKEGASVLKDHVHNSELLPEDMRDSFGETLSQLRSRFFRNEANENVPTQAPVTAAPQPEFRQQFMLPWFRPVRFLQRVQQAIN